MKTELSISETIGIAAFNNPLLDGITKEQSDACLLADAAPGLLAACQMLLTRLDGYPDAIKGSVYDFATNAIAKATR